VDYAVINKGCGSSEQQKPQTKLVSLKHWRSSRVSKIFGISEKIDQLAQILIILIPYQKSKIDAVFKSRERGTSTAYGRHIRGKQGKARMSRVNEI